MFQNHATPSKPRRRSLLENLHLVNIDEKITPVIMAEQIKQEVIVKVNPDDF